MNNKAVAETPPKHAVRGNSWHIQTFHCGYSRKRMTITRKSWSLVMNMVANIFCISSSSITK